jgi:Ca2+-binding EF-hand superfamily protein
VTEEEVVAAKTAFDLFDSDQGGSVDIKGTAPVT